MIRKTAITIIALLALAACDSTPPLKPLAADAVILAYGDSLTYGVGAKAEESYPAVLAQLSGRTVINAGIPGEISAEGLERLPETLEAHRPQLLILCHGGNDILRRLPEVNAEKNIRAMVKVARERGVDVVLVAVPDFNLWAAAPAFYATIANELAIPFEPEIIGKLQKNRQLKSDSVHFNAEGYRQLAEAIHTVLDESGAL